MYGTIIITKMPIAKVSFKLCRAKKINSLIGNLVFRTGQPSRRHLPRDSGAGESHHNPHTELCDQAQPEYISTA